MTSKEGIFRKNAKGFGFVDIGEDQEIYISKENTNNALNGDKVLIEILEEKEKTKKAEGKVEKIIKHEKDTVVGTFQNNRNFGFVVPDDKNLGTDIFISKSVESLWESLGYKKEKRNFNYFFPKEIDDFVDIVNEFSKRKMTKEEIIYEINSISLSKMKMLYTQVKSILDTKELQG